jgi:ribosomal protein S18 acetylase RimI-like enzyme
MAFEIIPFQDEMFQHAAVLLAARHRQNRLNQPDLPALYEELAGAERALMVARQRKYAQGVAAIDGSQLLGFLTGDLEIDTHWGRSAWVRPAGYAVAEGQSPELLRDLYAVLGDQWLKAGCFFHFVLAPAQATELTRVWFSLSFGIEHVRAIQSLENLPPGKSVLPAGVQIRQLGPEDRELIADFSNVIWTHQVLAPVWAIQLPEGAQREGWAELAEDPQVVAWLATLDGKPAATQSYYPSEQGEDMLFVPEQTAHLAVAGTRPWARRHGLMRALTQNGLADIYAKGFHWCETDWRSTNLLSSRYWPRQGFKSALYRLTRRIDPRITWANGQIQL